MYGRLLLLMLDGSGVQERGYINAILQLQATRLEVEPASPQLLCGIGVANVYVLVAISHKPMVLHSS
jgi:hypothetical protein